MNEWNLLQFAAIVAGMEDMTAAMDNFALRCKKMPGADSEPKMNLNLIWWRRWRRRGRMRVYAPRFVTASVPHRAVARVRRV